MGGLNRLFLSFDLHRFVCGCSPRERETREATCCPSKKELSTWQCRHKSVLKIHFPSSFSFLCVSYPRPIRTWELSQYSMHCNVHAHHVHSLNPAGNKACDDTGCVPADLCQLLTPNRERKGWRCQQCAVSRHTGELATLDGTRQHYDLTLANVQMMTFIYNTESGKECFEKIRVVWSVLTFIVIFVLVFSVYDATSPETPNNKW